METALELFARQPPNIRSIWFSTSPTSPSDAPAPGDMRYLARHIPLAPDRQPPRAPTYPKGVPNPVPSHKIQALGFSDPMVNSTEFQTNSDFFKGTAMFGIEAISPKSVMAIVAAIGYALAALFMKMTAENPSAIVWLAIALTFLVTAIAEVMLLRQVDLGMAYVAIIATETLVILAATFMIGEAMTPKQLLGGAFVIAGAVLASF